MRTYSKRHNRPPDKTVLDNVVDGQTNRKRVYHSETEGRPRKRNKSVDQAAMSGTFETPHPTLEANSQVYKLPSTKPIPSPTPFSPVPNKPRRKALHLRPRSYFVPTTSGSLKENAGSSKSLRRQSSKTLSSFTLTSGSRPTARNTRENGKQTRSPSRSSNSASSRSRSRDQKRLSKFKAKLIKKSKENTTINDLSEHRPSKSGERSFSGLKHFTKRSKSVLSNAEQTLLASPFASRAPSPIDHSNFDIAKSGWNEPMGPPALVEPKLAIYTRSPSIGWLLQDCDGCSSPEKPGTRMRSSVGLFDREPGIANKTVSSWKNRRPSAPSNLQRPSKPVGKAHTPAKRTAKTDHKQFKKENGINCCMGDQKFALPRSDGSVANIKDWNKRLSVDNPNPFFWMQERSAVDFNRPPSQLSLHLPSAFIPTEDDPEAEGVFWSSGEDNDNDNDQPNQRLGAKLEAPNPAWLTSTPYEKVIARRLSLPTLEGPSIVSPNSCGSMNASGKIEASVAVGDKIGEDMELTTPLDCGGIPGGCQNDSMSFQEHTPWVTDSIISPPTAYLEKRKPFVNVENVEKEEHSSSSMVPTQSGALSSPFRSYAESTSSVESAPMDLHELVVGSQELKEEGIADGPEDKGNSVQPQGPPQRTRSGTILGGRNGPVVARRTRTGTIIGPSTIGRTRSGTIVAKVKIPEQNVAVVGNRRTRSGSVIGPVPNPSGNKGAKSSTSSVSELEPISISNALRAEEVHATVGDKLTQIERTCSGNESSMKEVNEAECYVDSLYLTSSPDPIDFLTGGKVDGDESALVVAVGDWQVADEPPSPEMRRTKKTIQTPRGVGSRSITGPFKLKGRRKNRARFLGTDGQEEGFESDNPKGSHLNFGDDTSDDELLLVEGQSQSLFG